MQVGDFEQGRHSHSQIPLLGVEADAKPIAAQLRCQHDQKNAEKFAAKKVTVKGAVDAKAKTIQVDSMVAAK